MDAPPPAFAPPPSHSTTKPPLPMKAPWQSVAIVGVGLIGGSIGLALKARGIAQRVIGVGRSEPSLAEARRLGAVDETTTDLAAGVATANLVVVASSVASIGELLGLIDAAARPGTLLTDAGSTKGSIVAGWEKMRRSRRCRFVGSHPIAGSHRKGPAAAAADLFTGRVTVVTPAKATPQQDTEEVAAFWSALGSTVFLMPPKDHDRLLAATSHVPHVVAAALAAATPAESIPLTAGGWRDSTRIAAGDPGLWADILLDNAPEVVRGLRRVAGMTARMQKALETHDRRALLSLLERAKERRDAVGS
ncbi:MAG: prephenate dehydrogenase/arogenate dehydrogenase family protein [Planctomycetota bacterium]|nr:MAG: prephenate dehydrogenase/arogenate dehydrogenase family protein [Planctomycetota bacterium]